MGPAYINVVLASVNVKVEAAVQYSSLRLVSFRTRLGVVVEGPGGAGRRSFSSNCVFDPCGVRGRILFFRGRSLVTRDLALSLIGLPPL